MKKEVKKVTISPGCISCGTCEVICPKVFELKGTATVRSEVEVQKYKECVQEAAEMCPVKALEIEWETNKEEKK